jgi:hypothetical protein
MKQETERPTREYTPSDSFRLFLFILKEKEEGRSEGLLAVCLQRFLDVAVG